MSKYTSPEPWATALAAYLANRRAYGRIFRKEEHTLGGLGVWLAKQGANNLDEALFDRWRAQFSELSSLTRATYEREVYGLCAFRRRTDPDCFLPDRASLARAKPRPLPTIIEPQQVARLLAYASTLPPSKVSPLRPHVLRLAFVLLYTAGLRRGELVRLTLDDVDAERGVLHIHQSKFYKSRWVPLSASAHRELQTYLDVRLVTSLDTGARAPLLCWSDGRPYTGDGLCHALIEVMTAVNLRTAAGRCPRIQDFRHSFAVGALRRWYDDGADVQVNLPKLALYMGHVSIISTAYYLRWMPAVVARAGARFEQAYADVLEGGAS